MSFATDTATPRSVLGRNYRLTADWDAVKIEAVSGGFSGAAVFKVVSADGTYCLRRWPVSQTSSARVLAIHQVLELANHRGITAVPVPVRSDSGTTLPEVAGEFWQLEPWMPGVADFSTRSSDDRLKSVMTQLARFHNAIRAWEPTVQVSQWFQASTMRASPTVKQRISMIDGYASNVSDFEAALAKESDRRFRDAGSQIAILFRTAHPKVKQELVAVAELSVPLQPCIRDVWHDHLLFDGDKLSGIVDFGAMATDSVSCDLSRLLGSLFGDDSESWQKGLSHYESARPLTEAEHRLLRPLDRSSVLLSGMTWLKRRYVLRNTPADLSPVCDRLDAIVARLIRLAFDS
jgi:Ser/Thr protein kinase RdoA (MazF antagonist)